MLLNYSIVSSGKFKYLICKPSATIDQSVISATFKTVW